MKTKRFPSVVVLAASVLILLMVPPPSCVGAAEVALMTKEELKPLLDDETVIVIDVRTGGDWNASEFKIRGAIRVDAENFSDYVKTLPREKTIVLYCA